MRLKELRKKAHLTQHELATIIGVSRSTVAMWETGQNEPDNKTLIHLALFLNCSVDDLLGRVDRVDNTILCRTRQKNPVYDSDRRYDDSASTVQEIELLTIYRSLNDLGQQTLIGTARGLHVNPNMKKESRRVSLQEEDITGIAGSM